jgi:hypothetical protein
VQVRGSLSGDFVRVDPIPPDRATPVDVSPPHHADLARAGSHEPLKLHHRSHLGTEEGQGGLDVISSYWLHLGPLVRTPVATTKPGDGLQPFVDRCRYEFLGDGPAEDPLDVLDPLVDDLPAQLAAVDHRLPDGLELQWAELTGRGVPIGSDQGNDGVVVVFEFPGRRAVCKPVIALGVLLEPLADLGDGQVPEHAVDPGRDEHPGRQPFVDEPSVFPLTLLGAVLAEEDVTILPIAERQGDDGLPGLLVEAIAGEFPLVSSAHAVEPFGNSEDFRINQAFDAALPTTGRERLSLSAFNLCQWAMQDLNLRPPACRAGATRRRKLGFGNDLWREAD